MGTGAAAKLLGTTVKTLQRWEREGRLVPVARTASNRRRYTEAQLRAFLRLPSRALPCRVVAYCRVSSAAQRPDLVNQRRVLEQFTAARGLAGVEYVEEVGGDMDFRRERFFVLMDAMTIVYFFSSRLHGLRNYRRQLCAELEGGHAAGTSD